MAKIIYLLIFLITIQVLPQYVHESYKSETVVRNPFKPVIKNDAQPIVNAMISVDGKFFALIKYNDKNYTVTNNDLIGQDFKIEQITIDKVKVTNLRTDKTITLQLRKE